MPAKVPSSQDSAEQLIRCGYGVLPPTESRCPMMTPESVLSVPAFAAVEIITPSALVPTKTPAASPIPLPPGEVVVVAMAVSGMMLCNTGRSTECQSHR